MLASFDGQRLDDDDDDDDDDDGGGGGHHDPNELPCDVGGHVIEVRRWR